MDLNEGEICVQDTVHIGTKLRTRLLKQNIVLPMGDFFITPDHLKHLIINLSKDKHLLTMTDINSEDKMNFRSAEKISTKQVSSLLSVHVAGSNATIIYLKVMRNTLDAYLDKSISLSQRIHLIWYSVFVLRMWRTWLNKKKNFSITKNFISLNAYLCIEMNAHSLIKLSRKYRDDASLTENSEFTTWLFSSQACEKIFRSTRSLTSTFSTIVNYSLKDIISRLNKIETINNVTNDLSANFVFPRERNSKQGSNIPTAENNTLDDDEIEKNCMEALKEAKCDCESLGITIKDSDCMDISIWNNFRKDDAIDEWDNPEDNPEDNQEDENQAAASYTADEVSDVALNRLNEIDNRDNNEISESDINDIPAEINNDATLLNFEGNLWMKDTKKEVLDERSPFVLVQVKDQQNVISMRKSSLCWLLNEESQRLSSDRLVKYVQNQGKNKNLDKNYTQEQNLEKKSNLAPLALSSAASKVAVRLEHYYAVYYSDSWYIGRILKQLPDGIFEIKFLQASLQDFFWPKKCDVQMVDEEFIFFGPVQMKGIGPMTIDQGIRQQINNRYKDMKHSNK